MSAAPPAPLATPGEHLQQRLGGRQLWASGDEYELYLQTTLADQESVHGFCTYIAQHDTTVQNQPEAVKNAVAFFLFNKILHVAVSARYTTVRPHVLLQSMSLPSKLFAQQQLNAEIILRFEKHPNAPMTAQEVTDIKKSAINSQRYQYVLCAHTACFILYDCLFTGQRADFVADINDAMFKRVQALARKDMEWKNTGLWTGKYSDGCLLKHLALRIKLSAAGGRPTDQDSLPGLRAEQAEAMKLRNEIVRANTLRGNTANGIPLNQELLNKAKECLRIITADLEALIQREDPGRSVEVGGPGLEAHQASEDSSKLAQSQSNGSRVADRSPAPDQLTPRRTGAAVLPLMTKPSGPRLVSPRKRDRDVHIEGEVQSERPPKRPQAGSEDKVEQPDANTHQENPLPMVGTAAIAAHVEHQGNTAPGQNTENGYTPEEMVRIFPAEYLINRVGAHRLGDRLNREIVRETFSDEQVEAIRRGDVAEYDAARNPYMGVRAQDIRDELREFAHGPTQTTDSTQEDDPASRDVEWYDGVPKSTFEPDETASTVANQTGADVEVGESFLRDPEKESFEYAVGNGSG